MFYALKIVEKFLCIVFYHESDISFDIFHALCRITSYVRKTATSQKVDEHFIPCEYAETKTRQFSKRVRHEHLHHNWWIRRKYDLQTQEAPMVLQSNAPGELDVYGNPVYPLEVLVWNNGEFDVQVLIAILVPFFLFAFLLFWLQSNWLTSVINKYYTDFIIMSVIACLFLYCWVYLYEIRKFSKFGS